MAEHERIIRAVHLTTTRSTVTSGIPGCPPTSANKQATSIERTTITVKSVLVTIDRRETEEDPTSPPMPERRAKHKLALPKSECTSQCQARMPVGQHEVTNTSRPYDVSMARRRECRTPAARDRRSTRSPAQLHLGERVDHQAELHRHTDHPHTLPSPHAGTGVPGIQAPATSLAD